MNDLSVQLLGSWRTDPTDTRSLQEYGDVSLRFEEAGKLIYTIHLPSKEQIILLTYQIDDDCLLIDQPSSPRKERTRFYFTPDGRLALTGTGSVRPTFYVRASMS